MVDPLDAMWQQMLSTCNRPPTHDEAEHGWTVTQIMRRMGIESWNSAKSMCARKAKTGEWIATRVLANVDGKSLVATAYKPKGGQS